VLDFVKGFFCICWEDHAGFVLDSVYVLYYIYGFTYVDPSLHPWNETDLVMVFDLFDVFRWESSHIFIKVFCWESSYICSLKILVYNSFFWLYLYWVFGWVYCWLHRMSLVVSLPFLFPGKVWGALVLVLLERFDKIWLWIHQELGSFL
jgi:hypothetical protein